MEADQAADMVPASSPSTPSSCKQTRFMAKMKKKTCKILPTPQANTLRSRVRTPAAPHPPRRSRRIAGVEPELPTGGATSKYKKKVMRALDIIGETEGIDEQSLDEYSKLFSQSSWLPDTHVQAMAALFGWVTPDEEELSAAGAVC